MDELALALEALVEEQQPPRLRHPLDQQHARHHRPAGEVAEEDLLVDGDVLERHDPLLRLDLEHAVDGQERIAVRQDRQDPLDVPPRARPARRIDWIDCVRLAHSVPPSVSPGPPGLSSPRSSASRLSSALRRRLISSRRARSAVWRRHLRSSTAGMPATCAPGATAERAADLAATCAPSPSSRCPATPACPASTT